MKRLGNVLAPATLGLTMMYGGFIVYQEASEEAGKRYPEAAHAMDIGRLLVEGCSTSNPFLGDFEVATSYTDEIEEAVTSYDDPAHGIEEINLATQETFGFSLNIADASGVSSNESYWYSAFNDSTEFTHYDALQAMQDYARTLQHFSPGLIRSLNLSEIAIVSHIGSTNSENTELYTRGFYDDDKNTIFLSYSPEATAEDNWAVLAHELMHAIDFQLLCNEQDIEADFDFSQFNTIPYTRNPSILQEMRDAYLVPNSRREFFDPYSATDPLEDRAVTLEYTITRRGLILEGDPDYLSPLYQKQHKLVSRLEEVNPGVTEYLTDLTMQLRRNSLYTGEGELISFVENEHYPDEYMHAHDLIVRIAHDGLPVKVLTNGVVVYEDGNGGTTLINNPVLLRGINGQVNLILWNIDNNLYASFFDRHLMKVYVDGESPVLGTTTLNERYGELSGGSVAGTVGITRDIPTNMDIFEASFDSSGLTEITPGRL